MPTASTILSGRARLQQQRRLLLLQVVYGVLALLLTTIARAQPPAQTLRKDLQRDFGAVGDGQTNDQAAFRRAADFFNRRAQLPGGTLPALLFIPKGVYLVGPLPGAGYYSPDVLALHGCRNLTIRGADSASTEIRYAPGLRYGAFDPATGQPYDAPVAFFADGKYAATPGSCLVLQNCTSVTVSNLAINGNVGAATIGGHWGDTGIQLGFDGILVQDSRQITLRQLTLHHLGRDGVQVLNHLAKSLTDPQRDDIVLADSRFDYNGRQGLSITGVNGLQATNCSFSHTGRVLIPALGKALFSNPGAGVDLEPEGGVVANVRFDNCRFVDNAGQGIVADRPAGDHPPTTANVVFSNCLVWGTTNWSAWVTQPGFRFERCRFYGAFIHGCRAATPAEATRFVGCTFEDRPYHGQSAYGPSLLYSDDMARGMSFANCRFVGTGGYLAAVRAAATDTAGLIHLRNTTWLYDYTQPTEGGGNSLLGCLFEGNTIIKDGPHRTSQHRTTTALGSAGATTTVRAPGSLQLLATNCLYEVAGSLDLGRQPARARDSVSLLIGSGNTVRIGQLAGEAAEVYIGPTARLVVKKGGSLQVLGAAHFTVAGQLVVEDGATFYQELPTAVQLVGQGQLQVAPGASRSRGPELE